MKQGYHISDVYFSGVFYSKHSGGTHFGSYFFLNDSGGHLILRCRCWLTRNGLKTRRSFQLHQEGYTCVQKHWLAFSSAASDMLT